MGFYRCFFFGFFGCVFNANPSFPSVTSKMPTKNDFCSNLSCLLLSVGTFTSAFKDKKSLGSHETAEIIDGRIRIRTNNYRSRSRCPKKYRSGSRTLIINILLPVYRGATLLLLPFGRLANPLSAQWGPNGKERHTSSTDFNLKQTHQFSSKQASFQTTTK